MSLVDKFKNGLARSKSGFLSRLDNIFKDGELNQLFYEELEEILVTGDVGIETSLKIINQLKEEAALSRVNSRDGLGLLFREKIKAFLSEVHPPVRPEHKPYVILLVGVNGSGKTTTAGKLAHYYSSMGEQVMLVAGDTFRAAAVEQLEIWAERSGAEILKQQSGSDPSALYYDAINAAQARGVDVLIGDTAGRLHNKYNLMEELNKIYRVINRSMPGAPHQVMLVVDATTGQNALAQTSSFNESLPLNGLVLTKLDGTARGGIVIGIQDKLGIPVCYIGTGEKSEDLAPFDPDIFAEALLGDI